MVNKAIEETSYRYKLSKEGIKDHQADYVLATAVLASEIPEDDIPPEVHNIYLKENEVRFIIDIPDTKYSPTLLTKRLRLQSTTGQHSAYELDVHQIELKKDGRNLFEATLAVKDAPDFVQNPTNFELSIRAEKSKLGYIEPVGLLATTEPGEDPVLRILVGPFSSESFYEGDTHSYLHEGPSMDRVNISLKFTAGGEQVLADFAGSMPKHIGSQAVALDFPITDLIELKEKLQKLPTLTVEAFLFNGKGTSPAVKFEIRTASLLRTQVGARFTMISGEPFNYLVPVLFTAKNGSNPKELFKNTDVIHDPHLSNLLPELNVKIVEGQHDLQVKTAKGDTTLQLKELQYLLKDGEEELGEAVAVIRNHTGGGEELNCSLYDNSLVIHNGGAHSSEILYVLFKNASHTDDQPLRAIKIKVVEKLARNGAEIANKDVRILPDGSTIEVRNLGPTSKEILLRKPKNTYPTYLASNYEVSFPSPVGMGKITLVLNPHPTFEDTWSTVINSENHHAFKALNTPDKYPLTLVQQEPRLRLHNDTPGQVVFLDGDTDKQPYIRVMAHNVDVSETKQFANKVEKMSLLLSINLGNGESISLETNVDPTILADRGIRYCDFKLSDEQHQKLYAASKLEISYWFATTEGVSPKVVMPGTHVRHQDFRASLDSSNPYFGPHSLVTPRPSLSVEEQRNFFHTGVPEVKVVNKGHDMAIKVSDEATLEIPFTKLNVQKFGFKPQDIIGAAWPDYNRRTKAQSAISLTETGIVIENPAGNPLPDLYVLFKPNETKEAGVLQALRLPLERVETPTLDLAELLKQSELRANLPILQKQTEMMAKFPELNIASLLGMLQEILGRKAHAVEWEQPQLLNFLTVGHPDYSQYWAEYEPFARKDVAEAMAWLIKNELIAKKDIMTSEKLNQLAIDVVASRKVNKSGKPTLVLDMSLFAFSRTEHSMLKLEWTANNNRKMTRYVPLTVSELSNRNNTFSVEIPMDSLWSTFKNPTLEVSVSVPGISPYAQATVDMNEAAVDMRQKKGSATEPIFSPKTTQDYPPLPHGVFIDGEFRVITARNKKNHTDLLESFSLIHDGARLALSHVEVPSGITRKVGVGPSERSAVVPYELLGLQKHGFSPEDIVGAAFDPHHYDGAEVKFEQQGVIVSSEINTFPYGLTVLLKKKGAGSQLHGLTVEFDKELIFQRTRFIKESTSSANVLLKSGLFELCKEQRVNSIQELRQKLESATKTLANAVLNPPTLETVSYGLATYFPFTAVATKEVLHALDVFMDEGEHVYPTVERLKRSCEEINDYLTNPLVEKGAGNQDRIIGPDNKPYRRIAIKMPFDISTVQRDGVLKVTCHSFTPSGKPVVHTMNLHHENLPKYTDIFYFDIPLSKQGLTAEFKKPEVTLNLTYRSTESNTVWASRMYWDTDTSTVITKPQESVNPAQKAKDTYKRHKETLHIIGEHDSASQAFYIKGLGIKGEIVKDPVIQQYGELSTHQFVSTLNPYYLSINPEKTGTFTLKLTTKQGKKAEQEQQFLLTVEAVRTKDDHQKVYLVRVTPIVG